MGDFVIITAEYDKIDCYAAGRRLAREILVQNEKALAADRSWNSATSPIKLSDGRQGLSSQPP